MKLQPDPRYDADVCILGSGISGSTLATVLAKAGLRVVIIDAGAHPRFTIGEATIPETALMFHLLAERYGVPELKHFGSFHDISRHVSPACGMKRSISFVHHEAGIPHQAGHSTQMPTWAPPIGPDSHILRQDSDAYLLALAARYGAEVRQQTPIGEIAFDDESATVEIPNDAPLRVRFVADGTGYKSRLAEQMGLRESPCSFRTHSRSLFTHMVGVRPFDDFCPAWLEGLPYPHFQSTLHHVFGGGWIWVIPFNNHAGATNPLCSVGMTLDPRMHPKPDCSPEEEFQYQVGRFPCISRHFAEARPIRPWVSTGRLQYNSTRVAGARFCLLPHAAGFVDPLFSGGLFLTLWGTNVVARQLIDAVAEDDFHEARLAGYEKSLRQNLDYYDRLVACSYTSFRSFEVWNAWHRFWDLAGTFGFNSVLTAFLDYTHTRDETIFERHPYQAIAGTTLEELRDFLAQGSSAMERFAKHESDETGTIETLYGLIRATDLKPPPYDLANPARRFNSTLTALGALRLFLWIRYRAPAGIRAHLLTHPGRVVRYFAERLTETVRDRVRATWRGGVDFLRELSASSPRFRRTPLQ